MATSQPNSQQDQQPAPGSNSAGTEPQTPVTTQEDLAHDEGEGIRGGYGDSDQTNGLEGGGQPASPNQDDSLAPGSGRGQ